MHICPALIASCKRLPSLPVTSLALSNCCIRISAPATVTRAILRRRRSAATTTTESTTLLTTITVEAWVETRTGTLLVALLTTTVSALTVATGAAASAGTTLAAVSITAHHAARWGVGALLLDVGLRDDFWGQVQPLAEVVEAFGSEGVVVPLPRELRLQVAAGGEGLAGLDDLFRVIRM